MNRALNHKKPKVLLMAPRFPYPLLRGDQLTVFKMCEYFNQYWDIDLVLFEKPEKDYYKNKIPVNNLFILHNTWIEKILAGGLFLIGEPLQKHYFASIFKRKQLKELLQKDYDFYYVHTTRLLSLIPESFRPFTSCGVQISIALQNHRHAERANGIKKWFYNIESKRYRQFEKKETQNLPLSFVITPEDQQWLDLKNERTIILPHGVDVEKFQRTEPYSTNFEDTFTIIFSGNLDFEPNTIAIERLLKIFERIKKAIPHAKLMLVGKCSDQKFMERVNAYQDVEITGFVDSFTPYFNKASVMVNPLTVGSGLQNKNLEALSYGVPVICTQLANNGIKAPASCCIEADTDESIVEQVIYFYKNPPKAKQMHKAATKYVRQQFTWEYFLNKQKRVFEETFNLNSISV